MQHKKLTIAGLIILLLIDLGLIYQSYQAGKQANYETVTVERGDITEVVSATGSINPASQIDLQFTAAGRVTAVNIKTGDSVKAGQVLISLDSSDLFFQAQAAQASLQSAQAKLNQLLAGASAEDIVLAQTAVANAQKNLDDAGIALANAKTSADNSLTNVYQDAQRTLDSSLLATQNALRSNADTLDSTKLAVTNSGFSALNYQALSDAISLRTTAERDFNLAQTAVNQAKIGLVQSVIDNSANLLKTSLNSTYNAVSRTADALVATVASSALSQTDLDTFKSTISTSRSNVATALTNLVTAQQNISLQKIANQTNLDSAQASVSVAQGALATAQNQLAQKLAKPRQTDIDVYRAQVAQAQASLDQIKNQIAQKNLTAPIDGIVTNVAVELGEIASLGKAVVSMNSLSNFEIKSDIAETDIAKVAPGQKVDITLDAFGDKEHFAGNLIKIDPAQEQIQGVIYYKTTIGLEGADSRIKAGMTANLDIQTASHQNVLILPLRAVIDNGTSKTVKFLEGKTIKEKTVQTGLKSSDGNVEIISGVSENEQIIIQSQ